MISTDIFLLYIAVLISVTSILIIYRFLLSKELNINIFNIVIILVMSIFLVYNNIYSYPSLKIILAFLTVATIISIIYKTSLKIAILNYFVIWIFFVFFDILYAIIFSILNIMNEEMYYCSFNIIKIVITILSAISVFLTIRIKKVRKFLIKFLNFAYKNYADYVIVIMIIALISLLGSYSGIKIYNSYANIMFIPMVIILTIIIIYLVNLKEKKSNLEFKNQFLTNSNDTYNKIVEEYKIFKHNHKNKMLALRSVANKEVKKIIDEMLEITTFDDYFLPTLEKAPIGIRDIIFVKLATLDLEKVKISIENECEQDIIKKLTTKNYNLFLESMGIVIDNAIEAIKKCEQKIIHIDIKNDDKYLEFKLTNTFSNQIDLENFSKLNYTTKEKGQGIGIYSIFKRRGIKCKTKILNNKYQVCLFVKLKN